MTDLAAEISGKSLVTSVKPLGAQHQVQNVGMSLSSLISSPHTSIGRAESVYRSVMSTPIGLIATDLFMESVAASADVELSSVPEARSTEIWQLRLAIATFPASGNIVQIAVTSGDPALAARLADAVIDEFVRFRVEADVAESGASEEFFASLVDSYREDLALARGQVDEALEAADGQDDVPADRLNEIDRLQEAELHAEARYQGAVEELEKSRLAGLQTETDIRQRYAVLDEPDLPATPNGRLLDDVMTLCLHGLIGVLVAMLGPVALALLDRGVRFADELPGGSGDRVITTIPKVRQQRLSLSGVTVTMQQSGGQLPEPMGPSPAGRAPVAPPAAPPTSAPTPPASAAGSWQSPAAPVQGQAAAAPPPIVATAEHPAVAAPLRGSAAGSGTNGNGHVVGTDHDGGDR
jgi:hypothetical protein